MDIITKKNWVIARTSKDGKIMPAVEKRTIEITAEIENLVVNGKEQGLGC